MATRVTKTIEELYIDAANDVAPSPTKYTFLDAKIVLANEFDPTVEVRNEDQADRVILQAALDGAAPLPATQTVVSNGQALTVPVTGSYTTTATVTVAGGVVTGIVLS